MFIYIMYDISNNLLTLYMNHPGGCLTQKKTNPEVQSLKLDPTSAFSALVERAQKDLECAVETCNYRIMNPRQCIGLWNDLCMSNND